ncbi:MAG: sigma-70 family RNA polymerase sigma factor [Lunatimonas sp.]|uniref:RNA polymerase sigma factor n=1 Tax=Lunatimonas sp. TaxID=2060141 RepID=UPI00263AA5E7|nr:sigma-70 family RNA polymerase sigma factor [Lunatimonas sp.]MCC5935887.1 sigma-70 family RNA polymerase sigma factor [Lunatimonas sp.]
MVNSINPEIPQLVSKLREGDEAAFCALYRRFASKVYGTSRKMGMPHEDAEGIVQEVFMRIWKNRQSLKDELSFNAYLLAILKSLIYKQAKQVARFQVYTQHTQAKQEKDQNMGEVSLFYEDLRQFSSYALSTLPKCQKEVIELRYLQHLSSEEISQKLSISKRTVETHIYNATKSLREKLLGSKTLPSDLLPLIVFFLID